MCRASCVRDLTPSFRNTLCRWYSTVAELMNSRAAISLFVSPCAASRAICVSCGVRSSRVSGVRLRGILTGRLQLQPSALDERLHAEVCEELVGDSQLLASIDTSAVAPKPLAVEEVGTSELHADAGASEPLDRLPVELIGGIAVGEQCA